MHREKGRAKVIYPLPCPFPQKSIPFGSKRKEEMKICTGIIFGSCLVSLPSIHSLQSARQKQNEPKN